MAKKRVEKIGILGGTFDPIHNGHLKYAKEAADRYGLDRVFFIPTGNPPHKVTYLVTAAKRRLAMVKAATECDSRFETKSYEVDREGETYTVETLREIKKDYPDAELYYLIGTDVLMNLIKWKESAEVFKMTSFICASRDSDFGKEHEDMLKTLRSAGCRIEMMDFEPLEISSTQIREMFRDTDEAKKYLPEKVFKMIKKDKIYGRNVFPLSDDDIQRDLRDFLKKDRYEHSIRVMEEAVRIAKIVGADEAKCRTAGLVHDCGKNLCAEQLKWLGFTGEPTEEELNDGYNRRLLHARTGVIIAKERYGIEDPEILGAIRHHITGSPGMDIVSCVIFLADYTEKGREGEKFDRARRLLEEEGIYSAMLCECEETIKFVLQKGERLDVETIRTRNWLITEIEREKAAKAKSN